MRNDKIPPLYERLSRDDGVSGTRFNRPGFMVMMEAKKAALHAKDMTKCVFYIAGSVPPQEPQKINRSERLSIG